MASVKESMWSNIIKMKLTEEKRYCNFCLRLFSWQGETQCGGNVHNVSSTRVAEFDFLTENLDGGCLICAYSLWFSFKRFPLSHCVINVISRCKFCKNGFFNTFFPFRIHSILKLAPVLSQKSRKMHLVCTFCSSTAQTSTVTPIFYFMILMRTVLPFGEKKVGTNLCSVFGQFY